MILTSTLDWTPHINYVFLKASRKLNVLKSVRYLNRKTLDILYSFYHTLTQANQKHLTQIQFKAGKLVGAAIHYTSQLKLENTLILESVQKRAEIMGLAVFHKIHFNLTGPLVCKFLDLTITFII